MAQQIWPSYWSTKLSDEQRRALEAELQRELCAEHVLTRASATALAIGDDPDDVVFRLADGCYAAVHLTWHSESDPQWPYTLIFDDFDDLVGCNEWQRHESDER